jgi:chemotaxis-related protein WspB
MPEPRPAAGPSLLALVFEVAGERYALRVSQIVEVVRRPVTRAVPGAPPWIEGLWARGESWIPVIDMSLLIAGVPVKPGAATRVAVIERAPGGKTVEGGPASGRTRQVGLLGEVMTRVLDLQGSTAEGVYLEGREMLGAIVMHDDYGIQLIEADRVIPPEIDHLLFGAAAALGPPGAPS